jgi:hypothetical protein
LAAGRTFKATTLYRLSWPASSGHVAIAFSFLPGCVVPLYYLGSHPGPCLVTLGLPERRPAAILGASMKSHTQYLTFNIPSKMAFVNITPQVEQAGGGVHSP